MFSYLYWSLSEHYHYFLGLSFTFGPEGACVSLQTLTVGQVLLGCVSEVRDYELVVSLPHKLVGSVSLAHISRPYTALLSKVRPTVGVNTCNNKPEETQELYDWLWVTDQSLFSCTASQSILCSISYFSSSFFGLPGMWKVQMYQHSFPPPKKKKKSKNL